MVTRYLGDVKGWRWSFVSVGYMLHYESFTYCVISDCLIFGTAFGCDILKVFDCCVRGCIRASYMNVCVYVDVPGNAYLVDCCNS